jgi:quinol monooxygenase YgiN
MDPVVELRQYTLHPGQRDVLIDIFEREFVETQEAEGMRILGTFRDLGNPDRFVWLRSFTDMTARARGLTAFYSGPAWRANSAAANATMIDVDNVHLLRPTGPGTGFALDGLVRPSIGADPVPAATLAAFVHYLPGPVDAATIDFFDRRVLPHLGVRPLARLCTRYEENNFPALPVRTDAHVLIWFARLPDGQARQAERLALVPEWTERVKDTEVLMLAPTARSLLR